ncbi:MAG: Uxx-star family glutaredoxin-like (seleno)protein [Candidatus Pacebacteria bacterium]|nr:Uxx-star family glutaredoxin-like (seleno)protein [Candidatus Paceibacterota bacterium]
MSKVAIYTTPTCGYCQMAKEWFKEKGVEYEEHDVYSDMEKRKEMVEKTGQMGVPVIEVNGEFVVGFDKHLLSELLKI